MQNTKNLLSVERLTKYFEVGKSGFFGRNKRYLRANEQVSFSVKEGETFALVGESGCGKSTLGRTVLQLYAPSGGDVYYYGKNLDETLPKYLFKALKRGEKLYERYGGLNDREKGLAERTFGGFLLSDKRTFMQANRLLFRRFLLLKRRKIGRGKGEKIGFLEEIKRVETELDNLKKTFDKRQKELEQQVDGGVELSRLNGGELRALRKDLQIIFQDPYSSLNPRMTVGQLIEEGVATHKYFKKGSQKMREYVLEIMRECGLQPYMINRYPHQFSGGQRQRICIARALAVKPRFVVCDECVSALDASVQSQILNLLMQLKKEEKLTYLFISHDLSVVRYVADKVAVMYLGEIVETGKTKDVFDDARHPYTLSLLSSAPSVEKGDKETEKIVLRGHMPSPVAPPSGCKFHTRCFMACEICKKTPPPYAEVGKGRFVRCHFADKAKEEKLAIALGERANGEENKEI